MGGNTYWELNPSPLCNFFSIFFLCALIVGIYDGTDFCLLTSHLVTLLKVFIRAKVIWIVSTGSKYRNMDNLSSSISIYPFHVFLLFY